MEELTMGTAALATPGGIGVVLIVLYFRFLNSAAAAHRKVRTRVTYWTLSAVSVLLLAQVGLFIWEQLA